MYFCFLNSNLINFDRIFRKLIHPKDDFKFLLNDFEISLDSAWASPRRLTPGLLGFDGFEILLEDITLVTPMFKKCFKIDLLFFFLKFGEIFQIFRLFILIQDKTQKLKIDMLEPLFFRKTFDNLFSKTHIYRMVLENDLRFEEFCEFV